MSSLITFYRRDQKMNIYFLHHDPALAARYHNDRHVPKQILETQQMLAMAHHSLDGQAAAEQDIGRLPLHLSNWEHPCVRWATASSGNYSWLALLGVVLTDEYQNRFGLPHVMRHTMKLLSEVWPRAFYPPAGEWRSAMTEMPQFVPDRFHSRDPVTAYRSFYFSEKAHLAVWSPPADIPPWWKKLQKRREFAHQPQSGAIT
jgi:hypothetical protein